MGWLELMLIAVGLSMDAFAVSIGHGLSMRELRLKKALVVGLYFGAFQAVMPLIGYYAGTRFAYIIVNIDHWIAFILLVFVGGRMILGAFEKEDRTDGQSSGRVRAEASLSPGTMLPLAVATSIDALAVGVSFAFLQVNIIPAVLLIGITTLVLSMIGVKIGNLFGAGSKSKAELAGGAILILMGVKILFEHAGFFSF